MSKITIFAIFLFVCVTLWYSANVSLLSSDCKTLKGRVYAMIPDVSSDAKPSCSEIAEAEKIFKEFLIKQATLTDKKREGVIYYMDDTFSNILKRLDTDTRQYLKIEENGQTVLRIDGFYYDGQTQQFLGKRHTDWIFDGGDSVYTYRFNLKTKKIYDFAIHGVA